MRRGKKIMEDAALILVMIAVFIAGYFVVGRFGKMVDERRHRPSIHEDDDGQDGSEDEEDGNTSGRRE